MLFYGIKIGKKMNATKFSYDKSKIMRQAWTIYRSLRGIASFATALRNAWRLVKMQLRKAADRARKEAARLEMEARKAASLEALARMREAVKNIQPSDVDMYAWYRDGCSGQYTGD